MYKLITPLLLVMFVTLSGCEEESPDVITLDSLSVSPESIDLLKDQSIQLRVTASYSDGTSKDVTSKIIDDTEINQLNGLVSVSQDGLVSSSNILGEGIYKIVLSKGGQTRSYNLIITVANQVPSELQGKWRSISKTIYTHFDSYELDLGEKTFLNFKALGTSNTLLEVIYDDSDPLDVISEKYIRLGGSNTTASGQINNISLSNGVKNNKSYQKNAVGGIEVILSNIDTNQQHNTTTSPTGEFVFNDIPSGEYSLSANQSEITETGEIVENQVISSVDLNNSTNDLGVYTLAEASDYNFKTELIFESDNIYRARYGNLGFIYADYYDYSSTIKLRVHNIGSIPVTGLTFDVDCSTDETIVSCTDVNKIADIAPGSFTDISFDSLSFHYIDTPEKTVSIAVELTDKIGRKWFDNAYLKVFRKQINLELNAILKGASDKVRGYVISPDKNLYTTGVGYNEATLKLPYLSGSEYLLVLESPCIDETPNTTNCSATHSVGVEKDASTGAELGLFQNTFDPDDPLDPAFNNLPESSIELSVYSKIENHISGKDIDFIKIPMPSTGFPQTAVDLKLSEIKFQDRTNSTVTYGDNVSPNGNYDEQLNPGESSYLAVSVKNHGSSYSTPISVDIQSSDANISVLNITPTNQGVINSIPPSYPDNPVSIDTYGYGNTNNRYLGGALTCSDSICLNYKHFLITADAINTYPGYASTLTVTFTDTYGNVWNDSFNITVQ